VTRRGVVIATQRGTDMSRGLSMSHRARGGTASRRTPMTDPDIVNRLQADAIFFGTRQEPLLVDHSVCREMAECWESAADEIERLRAELVSVTNKLNLERDINSSKENL